MGYRPTWAEVDLTALENNFKTVRERLCPATKILVTVKADAYGHGLIPVSRKLVDCGVDYLGVASIDEGIQIRNAGMRVPLLILGPILENQLEPIMDYSLTPTVCTLELARCLDAFCRKTGRKAKVHVKVDTGMGRIGVLPTDALDLIRDIRSCGMLEMEGLFTHLAFADLDAEFTARQIRLFHELLTRLETEGIRIPLLHSANSMGLLNYPRSHFTMVRPGLIVYGLSLTPASIAGFRPALSLKTRVVYRKRVPAGYGISYGHSYVTSRETTVVTLPLGYGDGYPRNLSDKAPVLIHGRRFTISGKICMDQIMVDVGDHHVETGDEVVLIGGQGKEKIGVEELAALAGTIPYEIVCGLGNRIPRVYIDE